MEYVGKGVDDNDDELYNAVLYSYSLDRIICSFYMV